MSASADIETVTVHILDREYQVACPRDERAALEASARYLDNHMREIQSSGKVLGLERIAVMAALNLANDLLRAREDQAALAADTGKQVAALTRRIEGAIADHKQLEL